jgi:hypothetical protein
VASYVFDGLGTYYAGMAGSGKARNAVAAAGLIVCAAACSSGGSAAVSGTRQAAVPPSRHALGVRYLAIAVAGNGRLETGFGRLTGADKSNLARSRADLRIIAATERLFDQRLLAIGFPATTADVAWTLVQVNETRAALTTAATGATSLGQLRGYERQLDQANAPVEYYVRMLRAQLGLPPPETS